MEKQEVPELPVTIDGRSLTIEQLVAVARGGARVEIDPAAYGPMQASRAVIERLIETKGKSYGVTTGFGAFRHERIAPDQVRQLQRNLVMSHACGVGRSFPEDVVRAIILLRANALARGNSGVRPLIVERLLDLLNHRVYPRIPTKGSVGASGDLAPLAHLALVLIGEGEILVRDGAQGRYVRDPSRRDLVATRLAIGSDAYPFEPLTLEAKEGLALINGTQVMTALAALAWYDSERLIRSAEIVLATSLEALKGVRDAFREEMHIARPHPGQIQTAANVRAMIEGSRILDLPVNIAHLLTVRDLLDHARTTSEEALAETDRDQLIRLHDELDTILSDPEEWVRTVLAERGVTGDSYEVKARALIDALQIIGSPLAALYGELFPDDDSEERCRTVEWIASALQHIVLAVPRTRSVQDDYSFRCAPQVIGAARQSCSQVREVIVCEMNSATDNPLVFPPESRHYESMECDREALTREGCEAAVVSGGNFHGEPIGLAMDGLALAVAEVGSISERRSAQLVNASRNNGLPAFLVRKGGINSGYMIPQYTAAALVSENKVLCHPATADSIPTSADVEDHVSMGTIAARKAARILRNVEIIVGIELLCATQGLEFRSPLSPGRGTGLVYRLVRSIVPPLHKDRILYPEIGIAADIVASGRLLDMVTAEIDVS